MGTSCSFDQSVGHDPDPAGPGPLTPALSPVLRPGLHTGVHTEPQVPCWGQQTGQTTVTSCCLDLSETNVTLQSGEITVTAPAAQS